MGDLRTLVRSAVDAAPTRAATRLLTDEEKGRIYTVLADTRRRIARRRRPRWGNLRRTGPFDDYFGFGRGTPVDRVLLRRWFAAHAHDIRGAVLEVREPEMTVLGGDRVVTSDIVDNDPTLVDATIIADLADPESLPAESFDCILLPQTIQLVRNPFDAIANAWQALRPGGVLMLSVPTASRLAFRDIDRWRFTPNGLRELLEQSCPGAEISVDGFGSVLTVIAFIAGIAAEELDEDELTAIDIDHPLIACGWARKPEVTA